MLFISGLSEMSPLHNYNADVGDDDVFMVSVHFVTLLGFGSLPSYCCFVEHICRIM